MKRYLPFLPGLLALLAHAVALFHPFVFDDHTVVLENESIRHIGNLRFIAIGSRRALTNFSYAVDHALWGLTPFGYHLANLLLHACNALLLQRLALRVATDARHPAPDRAALLAASLFAVHPLLTESVGYVSARAGLLATACLLLGLLSLRRAAEPGRARYAALGLLFWLLGALGKETAAMLPFAWLAWDRLLLHGDPAARRARLWRIHLPLLALTAALAALRVASYLRAEAGFTRPPWQQLLTQSNVLWRYLSLFLLPIRQSVFHWIDTVQRPADPAALAALAALLALAAAMIRYRRTSPMAVFGLTFFLLLLAPSSAIPLGQNMAEHRTYEASVGLFLAAGAALARLAPRRSVAIALCALVAALAATTVARYRVWTSPVRLWQDAAAKAPDAWAAHYALADALRESGDCARAVPAYRRALALRPGEARIRRNLAICLAEVGPFDEAFALLSAELAAAPRDVGALVNLARLEALRGRPDAARHYYEQARALCDRGAAALERDACDRAAAALLSLVH